MSEETMTRSSIRLSDDDWSRLKDLGRDEESLSQIICRLITETTDRELLDPLGHVEQNDRLDLTQSHDAFLLSALNTERRVLMIGLIIQQILAGNLPEEKAREVQVTAREEAEKILVGIYGDLLSAV